MRLNDDFARRACVHAGDLSWRPSPTPGVDRKMLDRIGGEVARATSIVRYAPGSRFPTHVHEGGEEFLVLDGVFQDEHGDYPAGTYVRNPPQTQHAPRSDGGCTIFVKLRQFHPADRRQIHVGSVRNASSAVEHAEGRSTFELYKDDRETVRLESWAPHQRVSFMLSGGLEILVLEGDFVECRERFSKWSWLRLPIGATLDAVTGPLGCRLWLKEGHLRFAAAETAAFG